MPDNLLIRTKRTGIRIRKIFPESDLVKPVLILVGLFISLLVLFYVFIISSASQRLEDSLVLKTSLQKELKVMEVQLDQKSLNIIESFRVPEVSGYLLKLFTAEGITVEDIVIVQNSLDSGPIITGTVLKINVTGKQEDILQALKIVQQNKRFPLLIREIDINAKHAEINFELLMRKNRT